MTDRRATSRLNIYGDTFLKLLSPTLKKYLKIDVNEEVTLRGGTIDKLHRKLIRIYKCGNHRRKHSDNTALIMVGTHDIMNFKKSSMISKYARKLRKSLAVLIEFLERYHRHILVLTAPPILKMQKRRYHWKLLRKYNRHIKSLSENPKVKIVDLFPIFVETEMPPTCNSNLYVKPPGCSRRDGNVLWNELGIKRAVLNILEVVNVEKLQSSGVDKFEREEICSDRSIMTSRLEDACLGDDGHQCAAISYFTGNSLLERSSRICLPCEQGEKYSHYSTKEDQPESIYNAHTVHLLEDIKQKLSWIRHTQYSYYGEELVKDNKLKSIQNELISVATYNVLSQELLEKHNYLYSSHDHRSLRWSIRRDILLEELALLNADVLCLQEVDSYLVESFYDSFLNEKGYQGVYKRRTHGKIDGCAIYFKSDKFNLVESSKVEFFMESVRLLNRDNIGIVLKLSLKDRPDVELIAATTHLLYNPKRADIKLAQTQVMLAEIERLAYKSTDPNTSLPKYLPIIFTGDMNYSPDSAIYQLVTKSHLSYEGMSNKYLLPYADGFILQKTLLPAAAGVTDTCQYASSLRKRENSENLRFESGALDHNLKLSSVYNHVKKDCPEATTNQEKWVTVDYIFYSQPEENECGTRKDGNLKLVSKLSLPNSVEAETELRNIPNLACASDHLPLLATFHLSGS